MINSVGMNSAMSMMGIGSTQRQPPPPDKDVFKVADSDSDGLVSSSELETLAAGIDELTGSSFDVDEAMTTYDADGDGSLSGEELFGLMSSQGFNPGGMVNGEESGMMPPPPPPPDQAASAYGQNSGEDTLSQLIELLKNGSESEEEYTVLELSA